MAEAAAGTLLELGKDANIPAGRLGLLQHKRLEVAVPAETAPGTASVPPAAPEPSD